LRRDESLLEYPLRRRDYIEGINKEGEFISSSIILLNTLKRGEVFGLRGARV
jgi:hypothetical protein